MAGTKVGGAKTAKTNKRKYGRNYYREIGAEGGKKGRTGGFYYLKATGQLGKIREAGRKGGIASRRGPDFQKGY